MKAFLVPIAGLIVLVVVGFLIFEGGMVGDSKPLPNISLVDTSGETLTIQDFENGQHALVINSWATWCPFCVEELPDLISLQEEYEKEIIVIAVNRKEPQQEAEEFLGTLGAESGIEYLYDQQDRWYRLLGGFSMPETIFVNNQGEIIVHKRGFMRLGEMREHVEKTLRTQN